MGRLQIHWRRVFCLAVFLFAAALAVASLVAQGTFTGRFYLTGVKFSTWAAGVQLGNNGKVTVAVTRATAEPGPDGYLPGWKGVDRFDYLFPNGSGGRFLLGYPTGPTHLPTFMNCAQLASMTTQSNSPPVNVSVWIWGFALPFYWIAIFSTGVSFVAFRRWFKLDRFNSPGLCSACGYDLRASPARCPECGQVAVAAT